MMSKLPTITLLKDTEETRKTRAILLNWFEEVSLDKWLYTETIQLDEGIGSNSHPILKMKVSKYLNDPERILAIYIHEQMHWFLCLEGINEHVRPAIAEFRQMFTDIPVGGMQGCRSEYSNYLHILVNTLEYQAITELLGREAAKSQLEKVPFYTSVYKIVLEHKTEIAEVMKKYGVILPELPPEIKRFVEVS